LLRRRPTRLGSLKWFVGLSILLLVAGFVSGVAWPMYFAHRLMPILGQMRDLAVSTESHHSVIHTIGTIFLHNVYAACSMMVFGLLAGIWPAVQIWLNGLLMGFVTAMGVASLHTTGWKIVVFAMLPHGIFELAGILWASALGIQLGFTVLYTCGRWVTGRFSTAASQSRLSGQQVLSLRAEVKHAVYSLPVIIGLLLLAACIEGGITPHIIQWGILNHR
jgi:stage II sporulation protein M